MYWYRTARAEAQAVFTDRELGNLALHVPDDAQDVLRRRRGLEQDLGLEAGAVLYLEQVHGTHVVDADAVAPGATPVGDAAVSAHGRPLAVMVADCVPIVLTGRTAPETRPAGLAVTAVAHAGRRGLLDGVLPAVVSALRDRGAVSISALIGPSVCGRCYEVPEEMAAESERLLPGIRTQTRWSTPGLDLPGAAHRMLRELGVQVELIESGPPPAGLDAAATGSSSDAGEAPGGSSRCTLENPGLFSHRRDPGSGRIAGVIVATAPGAAGL